MTESDFVKELINRFLIDFNKNDRSGIYGLIQKMLAYNSNKIEGSTLTEKQTASLFETGSLAQEEILIRAKNVEEMTGHFMMFNEMLKTYNQPLSHELIKNYHFKRKVAFLKIWKMAILLENIKTEEIKQEIFKRLCLKKCMIVCQL